MDRKSLKIAPLRKSLYDATLYIYRKIDYNVNMHHINSKKLFAFTLAEVLITLGIIGVVASLTMPSLIAKQKEKEYVAKLKKFNSLMNQAMLLTIQEEGEIENWGLTRYTSNEGMTDEEIAQADISRNLFADKVKKHLKVIRYCPYGDSCKNQVKKVTRQSLDGTEFGTFSPYLELADGTHILGITITSPTCTSNLGNSKQLQNICGEIFVDVNGGKGPNATGKDVFLFYYTKYGVVPMGTAEETSKTFNDLCNKSITNKLNGYGCAAWVIYNENMDYLHCNDLSWDSKTKCK